MKKVFILLIVVMLIIVLAVFVLIKNNNSKNINDLINNNVDKSENNKIIENNMILQSSAFQNNESIPSKYTCDGENINPPLEISKVPKEAKSLVLINDDPDAPAGTWLHWTVWNIDPTIKEVSENSIPEGSTEGTTSFGSVGYGGPCPPSGTHRYFFKLYALDTILSLESGASLSELEKTMEGHIINKTELVGLYKRN